MLLCSLAILLLESKDFKVGVIELQGSFKLLHRVHSCVKEYILLDFNIKVAKHDHASVGLAQSKVREPAVKRENLAISNWIFLNMSRERLAGVFQRYWRASFRSIDASMRLATESS